MSGGMLAPKFRAQRFGNVRESTSSGWAYVFSVNAQGLFSTHTFSLTGTVPPLFNFS